MCLLVLYAADDADPSEIANVGADPRHAAQLREAAVGGDDEARDEGLSRCERNLRRRTVKLQTICGLAGHELDGVAHLDHSIERRAQDLVADEIAERCLACAIGIEGQEAGVLPRS